MVQRCDLSIGNGSDLSYAPASFGSPLAQRDASPDGPDAIALAVLYLIPFSLIFLDFSLGMIHPGRNRMKLSTLKP